MHSSNQGNKGLTEIIDVLASAGIDHWVDSGVLLGLVRSGCLNSWEKDIDLGVTGDCLETLLEAIPKFESIGYQVGVNRYRGIVFSMGMKPRKALDAEFLRVAIHVYYRIGDQLWSPQVQLYVPPPAPDVYQGSRSLMGRLLQRSIERWFPSGELAVEVGRESDGGEKRTVPYRVARWLYRRIDRGVLAETWPIREIYVPMAWLVPIHLVLPVSHRRISGRTYSVPARTESYLGFRYGDTWRIPVKSWCYWEDDGAIVREPPLVLRRRLLSVANDA